LTFIVLDFEEDNEGATKAPLKTQVVRSIRVLGVHFWCAPIDLNEHMNDIEEVNGMST